MREQQRMGGCLLEMGLPLCEIWRNRMQSASVRKELKVIKEWWRGQKREEGKNCRR
jgi:hypothetical protein